MHGEQTIPDLDRRSTLRRWARSGEGEQDAVKVTMLGSDCQVKERPCVDSG